MLSFGQEDSERAWVEVDLSDLRTCAARGDSLAEIAAFLIRTRNRFGQKLQNLV
jgi:hypothetical protein